MKTREEFYNSSVKQFEMVLSFQTYNNGLSPFFLVDVWIGNDNLYCFTYSQINYLLHIVTYLIFNSSRRVISHRNVMLILIAISDK